MKRLAALCLLGMLVAGSLTACGDDQKACQDADKAAGQLLRLGNPSTWTAADAGALNDVFHQLTDAAHTAGDPTLISTIDELATAVDDARTAVDHGRPVDAQAVDKALNDQGNKCSQVQGG